MSEILRKLTSRKLWLALAGVATGVAMVLGVEGSEITSVAGAVTAIASVITYIITEGKVDAAAVKTAIEATQNVTDNEGNDKA
jgi:hypothetical protein